MLLLLVTHISADPVSAFQPKQKEAKKKKTSFTKKSEILGVSQKLIIMGGTRRD